MADAPHGPLAAAVRGVLVETSVLVRQRTFLDSHPNPKGRHDRRTPVKIEPWRSNWRLTCRSSTSAL